MRKIIFIFLCICTTASLIAQDNILQTDGSSITAKVLEIGINKIKYKRFDNLDGPTYSIDKTKVFMIRYENGTKDIFSPIPEVESSKEETPKEKTAPPSTPPSPPRERDTLIVYRTRPKNPKEIPLHTITDSVHSLRNYFSIGSILAVGFNRTNSVYTNQFPNIQYTSIGLLAGMGVDASYIAYFARKKMPRKLGVGLNISFIRIMGLRTDREPYYYSSVRFCMAAGLGPQLSLRVAPRTVFDAHLKAMVGVVPVANDNSPSFQAEIYIGFRFKSFSMGLATNLYAPIYADVTSNYVNSNSSTSSTLPYYYSYANVFIGANINKKSYIVLDKY